MTSLSSSSSGGVFEDVFKLLTIASENEEKKNRIEAATKYYEAVHLMKLYLERNTIPTVQGQDDVRQLVQEKIRHYEQVASALINNDDSTISDDPSTGATVFSNPRSPFQNYEIVVNQQHQPHQPQTKTSSSSSSVCNATTISALTDDSTMIHIIASQANTQLAHALDLDEEGSSTNNNAAAIVAAYMKASETFLTALQATEKLIIRGNTNDSSTKMESIALTLKRRLSQTLDRMEQLKQKSNSNVKAADNENPLKTSVLTTPTPSTTTTGRLVQVPKKQVEGDTISTVSQQSRLTAEEISILKKSSLIASGLFLPWSDTDAHQLLKETIQTTMQTNNNTNKNQQQQLLLYTDPDGFLTLSPKQKERFYKWARPNEIVQIRKKSGLTKNIVQTPVIVRAITPYTIKQQYVTDCSFIASLCICAAYERRFQKKLITSILHPQRSTDNDDDGGGNNTLLYNPNGKYMIKLWLNGVARAVIIDDYFPIDKNGNLLCSHSTYNPKTRNGGTTNTDPYLELWVCLIEKAYMKLCRGYDFPGSNSGVDLFSLTGWIPERIMFAKDPTNLKDYETHPERAFARILSASSFGDCLITVSTELQLTETQADAIGLVTGHAYAVLDVLQTKNGTRLVQLKNPWAHKSWKGRYSSRDTVGWADVAFRNEVGYNPDLAIHQDDGIFWVCWEDILQYFQNFHLSWNPWLFQYRLVTHGYWPQDQGPHDDTYNVGDNPQYRINFAPTAITKKATIWLLISRHVTKQEQSGIEPKDYLTLHLHRNNKKDQFERIWYPGKSGNCVLTGVYTNNPHVLIRYDIEGNDDASLTAVLSQYKKSNDLGYTLSCYCTEDFTLSKPPSELEYSEERRSEWTSVTCGGPVGNPSYHTNPMFAMKVPDGGGAIVQMRIATSSSSAVNVLCFPVATYGDGIDKAIGEPVIDSGNYRHGFVVTKRTKLKPGAAYVAVVSNYFKGEKAIFTIKVSSSCKVQIQPIIR